MTAHAPIPRAGPARHRFTLDDVLAMVAAEQVPRHVELVDGEILDMPSEGEAHIASKIELARFFIRAVGDDLRVGVDTTLPLAAEDAPSPDLYIIARDAVAKMGRADAVRLVIEIADTTLAYDLNRKAALYASYGVPEYWVIDVQGAVTHVLTEPEGAVYRSIVTRAFDEPLIPLGLPHLSVAIADILRGLEGPTALAL
jgi:Uma2 family endonuclease